MWGLLSNVSRISIIVLPPIPVQVPKFCWFSIRFILQAKSMESGKDIVEHILLEK